MTFDDRQKIRTALDALARAALDSGGRKRGDKSRCSICERPIDQCGGLSPGRSWGRKCETRRKLDQYHGRKA